MRQLSNSLGQTNFTKKEDGMVSFVVRQKTVPGRRKKNEEFIPSSYLSAEIQLKDIISE